MTPTKRMFADQLPDTTKQPETPHEAVLGSPGYNVLDLPSKGRLGYSEAVEYRDIMVGDEETLSLATTDSYFRTLNGVLKSLLNEPDFYYYISIYDRDYILMWLWANNYSAVKDVSVTCGNSKCKHTVKKQVDLTEVEISELSEDYPTDFKLPLTHASVKEVNIRLNTVQDEIAVEEYRRNNPNVPFSTLMHIASVHLDFDIPFVQKVEWVRKNITGREMGTIKEFHKHFKYGVPNIINHTCEKCGEVTSDQLPFQAEDVLFPTVQSNIEELLRPAKNSKAKSK